MSPVDPDKTMLLNHLDIRIRQAQALPDQNNTTLDNSLSRGGCPDKGQSEIVDPEANMEEIFDRQQQDLQKPVMLTQNTNSHPSMILSHSNKLLTFNLVENINATIKKELRQQKRLSNF
jgi:hypothetical protein